MAIVTYRERMFRVRRDFELQPDRVIVQARWLFGRSYRSEIPLANLKGPTRTALIRQKIYRQAGWLMALGFLAVAMLVYRARGREMTQVETVGAAAVSAAASAGLLLMLTTRRKIRFVVFEPQPGHPALDIGQAGPDQDQFDDFIGQIQKRVRKA